jgi:hypothetical protein
MDRLRTIGMSRASWDALAPELKREEDGRCYVVDPTGASPELLVEFTEGRTTRAGATPRSRVE